VVRAACATAALLFALAILRSRLALSEMLYLLLPIAACSRLRVSSGPKAAASSDRAAWSAVMVAVTVAALPFACFAAPYIIHRQLPSLVNGLLILPQRRLMFASMEMPPAYLMLLGIPLVALLTPFSDLVRTSLLRGHRLAIVSVIVALPLTIASLYNSWAYQILWQSSRAFGALLRLGQERVERRRHVREVARRRSGVAQRGESGEDGTLPRFPHGFPSPLRGGARGGGQSLGDNLAQ